jgi:hypothetical protein
MTLRQCGHWINSFFSSPILSTLNFLSQCGHGASISNIGFLSVRFDNRVSSDFIYDLRFVLTSSSTIGTNADSMLVGLTNIE